MQVRQPYIGWAFPDAKSSSAYNMDVGLAFRRNCFEGNDTWLNTVERGKDYAAGDLWGCVGTWFSGRWYTQASNGYVGAVQDYLGRRIWETPDFING
jgi:autotransporter family porin